MDDVKDSMISFLSGSFTGLTSGVVLLDKVLTEWVIEYPVKIAFVCLLSFMGGIAGLAGKDFYRHKIKNKFFKNQNDGENIG